MLSEQDLREEQAARETGFDSKTFRVQKCRRKRREDRSILFLCQEVAASAPVPAAMANMLAIQRYFRRCSCLSSTLAIEMPGATADELAKTSARQRQTGRGRAGRLSGQTNGTAKKHADDCQ